VIDVICFEIHRLKIRVGALASTGDIGHVRDAPSRGVYSLPVTLIPARPALATGTFMKITVDQARYEVHGECIVAAPEVFDLGRDDEVVRVLNPEPSEELRAKVENAVKMCPVAAITLAG
jgi:ferredoxin